MCRLLFPDAFIRMEERPMTRHRRRIRLDRALARPCWTAAITATARKLAILVYRALNGDFVYQDPGADAYAVQQRTRLLRRLRQRAATFGVALVNRDTGELLSAGT